MIKKNSQLTIIKLLLIMIFFNAGITYIGIAQERPNIVLIMVDDMGFSDLGVTGSEIDTPNIDALAKEGMLFTQFYNAAKCEITRGSLMTGLYSQQISDTVSGAYPIVLGESRNNNATIAELLGNAGYETIASGKWHLGNWTEVDLDQAPIDRGFDHFFGHLSGAIDYFTGVATVGYYDIWEGESPYDIPQDFYSTDAFTDYEIDRITASATNDSPFFLYLSYNAPHFPLQVPQENIDEYLNKGLYSKGWDRVRQHRYERQLKSGIIAPNWALGKRDTFVPNWDSLTPSQQVWEEVQMATYAGMIDRLDQQVGRLIKRIQELGMKDNTLLMFLSDNGGHPFGYAGVEWATVSNIPFQKYKQWHYEGGIATPLIVRWPNGIKSGTIIQKPAHILDIMPTLLEVAGVTYPNQFNSNILLPLEGESLWSVLQGRNTNWQHDPIVHEFDGQRMVRDGDWKLVAERGGTWELYNMSDDRTETNNLVEKYPYQVIRLSKIYSEWAERIGATSIEKAETMPVNTRPQTTFTPPLGSRGEYKYSRWPPWVGIERK